MVIDPPVMASHKPPGTASAMRRDAPAAMAESDPLIGRRFVTLSRDEVECFAERAATIEEGAGVDRQRSEWLAFSELERRFAAKRGA